MKKIIFLGVMLFAALTVSAAEKAWCETKLPPTLVNSSGKKIDAASLRGKNILLYFSASWCGPCRSFTPQLVKFHKQTAKKGNYEIIFVTSDRDNKAMMDYMKKNNMPWLAIPFGSPQIAALKKEFKVSGIPTLVVLNSRGKLISANGRSDVMKLGAKAVNVWKSGKKSSDSTKNNSTKNNTTKKSKKSKKSSK